MMKKTFVTTILAMLMVSANILAQTNLETTKAKFYGTEFKVAGPVEITEVLTTLQKTDEVGNVQVKGVITEVCQRKGCWMKLQTQSGDAVQVTFKDYGFFVPKDLAGKTVVLTGKAWINYTPVEDLKHYAEDAGKTKEEIAAITAAKREPRFEATGVAVY